MSQNFLRHRGFKFVCLCTDPHPGIREIAYKAGISGHKCWSASS